MQDATVQSTPQTSQAPAATAPAPNSYVAAAPAAPAPVAYQVGMNYPQAVPQATTSYQSSPTQYAPQSQAPVQAPTPAAPQENVWESAFSKVMDTLSAPVQSPLQGQQYPQVPSQYTQANYGTQTSPVTDLSAPQTWSPNQAFSDNSSQTSSRTFGTAIQEALTGHDGTEANAEVDSAIADYYNLSDASREVLNNFGMEAPAILNDYAVKLEGMLDNAVQWGNKAAGLIQGYAKFAVNEHQENLAYNEILTNPDTLSDYTLKFFGPNGPHPVYESPEQLETKGYPTQPAQQPQVGGQMPAPPAAAAPQQPENFWGSFNEQMARDPQNAWKVLNQAQPNTVQNKLFVME